MAPARIVIEWDEDDPAARVERMTAMHHAMAAVIPGARVRGDWGTCPSQDGVARGYTGGWQCQLTAGHDGLHQHERTDKRGTMLWVWSTDGRYYTFIARRETPATERPMPGISSDVPRGGPIDA